MAENSTGQMYDSVYGPIFQDHVTEFPGRHAEIPCLDAQGKPLLDKEGNPLVDHIPNEGRTLQEGTPQNATNFNFLRRGMEAANIKGDMMAVALRHLMDDVSDLRGEAGSAVLTNTEQQPFNNSEKSVVLALPRNSADYAVQAEIEDYSGGLPGHVLIYGKQRNGFKIKFTGSAKQVSINYVVSGGTK